MKNKIILLVFLVSTASWAAAQNWVWSRQIGSTDDTRVWSTVLDGNDDVYATGNINAQIDIGAPSLLTPIGTVDAYLAKYSNNGDYAWHKQIASDGTVSRGIAATDASNNAIFVAFYTGNITSGPVGMPASTNGTEDVLLVKYNAAGAQQWFARAAWGTSDVNSLHVTTDPTGNIYITGVSNNTIYFSTIDSIKHTPGKAITFVAKYDPDGSFEHATQINYSSTNTNRNRFVEIEAVNENEIYVAGFFADTVFAGSYTLSTSGGYENGLLLKIDNTGNVVWARMAGSTNAHDRFNGVATDKFGNVYITGYIQNSAIFDSTAAMSQNSSPIVSAGNFDMIVAKYNKNGTLRWKSRNGNTGADIGYGAYITENLVMFSGYYSGMVTFNNVILNSGATNNRNTGFFVYDKNGNPVTAQEILGNGDDRGESIEYDKDGRTYISGYFTSSDLAVGDSTYASLGAKDGFIAVYDNPFSSTFSHVKNISCNGGADGELTIKPYFGIAPFEYSWSAGVTTFIDSSAWNLIAGNYSVTITDSRDSTTTLSIELTEPSSLAVTFNETDLSCHQSQDGAITITPSGGTVSGEYNYNWSGGTGLKPLEKDQTGLSAGWYKVTVTDDNDCFIIDSVELTQPDPIMFGSSIVTPAIPVGSSNGAIDANVTGGTPAYTYAWAREGISLPGRVNDTLINLDGATYQLTVTDANACEADTSFVVPDESLLQINKYLTPVSCNGGSDGAAAVNLINRDPGASYTYNWSTGATDTFIVNLTADTYYLTITETGGLNRTMNESFMVTEPDLLEIISLVPTNVKCYGNSNGAITMAVTGGTPDYSYAWSSGQTTQSISKVLAGWYKVTVTDDNNCMVVDSAEVIQNDSISITFTELNAVTCNGYSDGSLQTIVTGGVPSYSYQWNDPGEQTSPIAINLEGGLYQILVQDSENCSKSASYNLIEPDPVLITILDTTNVSCYNFSDGSISLEVTGGRDPYDYSWSPTLPNSATVTDLPPFTYYLTVTDNTGICANSSFSFTVKRPAAELTLALVDGSIVDNACFGGSEGGFELMAAEGWGSFQYSINGVDYQTSPIFTGLQADNYTARVLDGGGCEIDVFVSVSEESEIQVSTSVIDRTILVTASGGVSPYTFTLDGTTTNNTGQFDNVTNGLHSVEVTDANDCGPIVINDINVETAVETLPFNNLSIYPNPSNGIFYFDFNALTENQYRVQVYNLTGSLVSDQMIYVNAGSQEKFAVDLSNAESGAYIVKLNGIALNRKLIIE
jgi:hypothetical protein